MNSEREKNFLRKNLEVTKQSPQPAAFFSTKPKSTPKSYLVMKPIIPFALLSAFFAVGAAKAASTTPVGYITHSIAGNTSGNPSGAATYLSATLVQPTEFAGTSTATPSGGSVITFSSGVPTTFNGAYVLEIAGGGSEGWWSAVISSTSTSITIADAFPQGLPANVAVTVRKFNTVKSLLGANTAGLNPFDGGATQADEIQFLNPSTGAVSAVSYLPETISGLPDEWFDFVAGVSADNYPIAPGEAVRVVRFGSSALSFTSSGEVKTTKTQVDVVPAENWIAQPLAAGGSFGSMNFFSQMVKFDGGTTPNDVIDVLNPDQTSSSYVALDETLGGGYVLDFVGGTDATSVVVPEGVGYVFRRDSSQAASVLTLPAPVIAAP